MDLAKHSGFTNNWRDYKSNWITTNQIKWNIGFWWEGKTEIPKEKPLRVENQQTQPTEDRGSGNRTCATLVEGQCSYHCATPVLNMHVFALLKSLLEFLEDRIQLSNDPDLVLGAIQCLCDLAHHLLVRLVSVSDPVLFCPDPGLWLNEYKCLELK